MAEPNDKDAPTVAQGRRRVTLRKDLPDPKEDGARYEVVDKIGAGGMGAVVSALDAQLGRVVAIKRMHEESSGDAGMLRRFWIEAQVGAQLEHPNIVPVYEMEGDVRSPAFTMRLLGRRTLGDYIEECRGPSHRDSESHTLAARLRHFQHIASAAAYAHSRGVIHRDLKPQNVVLGHHGELYVVDWGIAKLVGDAEASIALSGPASTLATYGETQLGDAIGTCTYMPPEQAEGELEQQGPASDQFALGMILQELVTLRPPREGLQLDQVLAAAEAERLPMDVAVDGAPVPPELRAIVARATAEQQTDRYPSVEELSEDVDRFLRGVPVSVHRERLAKRVWRRLSRRPALTLLIALGVLVVALLGAIAGLVSTVLVQARASAEVARLEEITGMVIQQSEAIDSRFARGAELVEGIAMAATTLHESDRPVEGPIPYGGSGVLAETAEPRFTDLHEVPGYDYPVSFTRPAYHYPEDVDPDGPRRHMRVLQPLAAELRDSYLRSMDEEASSWTRARQDEVMNGGQVPLWALYVAFEDGLMLSYPGWIPLSEGYDARVRPWYLAVAERTGIHFGNPYADAGSGAVILPCNRTLRDTEGHFLGVAGADFKLDDLATSMRVETEGWVRTSLVDENGVELVNTDQRGLRLEVTRDSNETAETGTRLDPSLWARIQEGDSGWWRSDDELVIFDPLEEPGWTFVVHFDPLRALPAPAWSREAWRRE